MGDFGKFLAKAYLRKLLTALGTYLLASGVISDAEAGGFVERHLEEVAGGVLLAGSVVWTYFYQRYVRVKVTTALALPEGASSETLKEVMGEKT